MHKHQQHSVHIIKTDAAVALDFRYKLFSPILISDPIKFILAQGIHHEIQQLIVHPLLQLQGVGVVIEKGKFCYIFLKLSNSNAKNKAFPLNTF